MKYLEKARELTRENFTEWLQEQSPNKVVGIAGDGTCCPIRNFLGSEKCGVTIDGYRADSIANYKPLPEWAYLFVAAVDSDITSKSNKVSAAKALRILAGIK